MLRPGVPRPTHFVYVDNVGVLGVVEKRVAEALEQVEECLNSVGLPTHEKELFGEAADVLGVEVEQDPLDGEEVLEARSGTAVALGAARRVGRDARFVGHCTFAGLVFRQTLATFHSCYRYARRMGACRGRLWPSVRDEIACFKGALPLLVSDWALPWCKPVTCSDASPWCYGAVEASWDVDDVKSVGREVEKARFSKGAVGPEPRVPGVYLHRESRGLEAGAAGDGRGLGVVGEPRVLPRGGYASLEGTHLARRSLRVLGAA